jgi:hypothetical protein
MCLAAPMRRGVPKSTAWRYDIESDHWKTLAKMPEPRYAGAAVSLGSYIYFAGGDGSSPTTFRMSPHVTTGQLAVGQGLAASTPQRLRCREKFI